MRIAYRRWSHALAAGLLLAGCKSNKDTELTPEAQTTAPAPKPSALAPAPTPAPVSDATLSYLEDLPDQKCRWVQHTPPGEPKTVFTAPRYCRLELAWKPDGREALVTDLTQHQIWRVDLATGTSTAFSSLPSRGTLGKLGFDKQGRLVALMEERYEEQSDSPSTLKMVETGTGEDKKSSSSLRASVTTCTRTAFRAWPTPSAWRMMERGRASRRRARPTTTTLPRATTSSVPSARSRPVSRITPAGWKRHSRMSPRTLPISRR